MERGLEKAADQVGGGLAGSGPRAGLGREHRRQLVEELPHARREHLLEPGKGQAEVPLKGGAGHGRQQTPAEIERAELGDRKAGLQPLQDLSVEAPPHAAVVIPLVEERKPGLLQRRKVAADRPRRDAHVVRQRRDGDAMA